MTRLWAFLRLGRPHFLASGFLFVAIGALLALRAGSPGSLAAYLWAQGFVTATQWMVHYQNDYHDRAGDALATHRSPWSGGSRVLPAGAVPPAWARAAAWVLGTLAVASAAGAWMSGSADGTVLALMALTLVLAAAYSTPPLRLQARGVGPLVTALILVGLVPLLAYRMQGAVAWRPLAVLAPLTLLLLAALLVIDIPDAAADRASGKRTPVVRWGARACAGIVQALLPAAFALAFALWVARTPPDPVPWAGFAAAAPWGVWAWLAVTRGDWMRRNAWAWLEFRLLGLFMAAASSVALALTASLWNAP